MALNLGYLGLAPKSWNKAAKGFFEGTPAEYEQVSNLTPSQLRIKKEQERSLRGAPTQVADYYRGLLGNDSTDFQAFAAPEMRQFQEDIIPGLAEQFAGMGAGGLSSSGFRNAAVQAGTDLSERLANLRAQLRQNAAQGLSGLTSQALTPHTQYQQTQAGSEGFLSQALPAVATAAGTAFGGPAGGFIANQMFGKSNPYGGGLNSLSGMSNSIQSSINPMAR